MTLHEGGDYNRMYLKGAPEIIIGMAGKIMRGDWVLKLTDERRAAIVKDYEKHTKKVLRLLAFAVKKATCDTRTTTCFLGDTQEDADLIFLGVMALKDPLRPSIKEMINITKQAGVRTVMVMGDHRLTATAIAKEIGLPAGR